ncbi:MAG: DsrE/DsrF/DrsH-like family protein, partial [Myxococcota bacterium]
VVELDLPGSATQAKSPVSLVPEIEPSLDADVAPRENIASLCVLRGDFESLMASMLVANGAAAQGMKVHIYFAFWGVNVLRGERPRAGVPGGQTTWLQRLMKWMMPRGPHRQKMSKMHMAGIGKGAMQSFMRKYDVMSLPQLLDSCVEQNITFIVCTMSMNMMGVEKRDIMDLPNIEWGGVSTFVERSKRSAMSLVF